MRKQMIPFGVLAAVLLCLSLTGIPWLPAEPLGNFSGKLIYNTDESQLDFSGRFNLYNCASSGAELEVKIFCNNGEHEIDVNPEYGTFTGNIVLSGPVSTPMEAHLLVEGEVVAKGTIRLPAGGQSRIHIIRFSSIS